MDPSSGQVVALREVLQEKFPEAHSRAPAPRRGRWQTGVPCVDALGVEEGMLVEITGKDGGGLVVAGLLEEASRANTPVALVDAADSFDPQEAGDEACRSVLWVRCGDGRAGVKTAIRATDLLLRDGNLPLVVADFQLCQQRDLDRIPGSTWFRLRGLVGRGSGLLVTLTPQPSIGCADLRVRLDYRSRLADCDTRRDVLLGERSLRAQVVRTRGAVYGEEAARRQA